MVALRNPTARVMAFMDAISDNHIPSMVVWCTGVFSIVLGAIFWFDAQDYRDSKTFAFTFEYAAPEVWAILLALTGLVMTFGYWLDGATGRPAAFVLTGIYVALGFTAGIAPLSGQGLLSASAVYTFVGLISAICVFACSPRAGGRRGSAADNNLHH